MSNANLGIVYCSPLVYAHVAAPVSMQIASSSTSPLAMPTMRMLARWGSFQGGVEVHPTPGNASKAQYHTRVVFSDTWRNPATRQPESVELALTLLDNASAATISCFRHTATRVNAIPYSYWRNTAAGVMLESTQVLHDLRSSPGRR